MTIKQPADFCQLWMKQNAVERLADQKAFDALPGLLREVVNDSPIQIVCAPLLLGCRLFGAETMMLALQEQLDEWQRSFAR